MQLTAICGLACLLLIGAEYGKRRALRIATKLTASIAFVLLGLMQWPLEGPFGDYGRWILIGLVLGAIGDAALLGKRDAAFLAGLGSFLLGHLAYVVAIACIVPPAAWIGTAGALAAVPLIAGAIALRWLWPRLGGMKLPVIGYVLAIVTMVVAAIAAWRGDALPAPQRTRLLVGALLFFASDLAVARDKFVAQGFVNRAWGLPAYYAGQLLIAWSLAGLA